MPDIKDPEYEFDTPDLELMEKVRRAVQFELNGDPMSDAIDSGDVVEALALLVRIVDGPVNPA